MSAISADDNIVGGGQWPRSRSRRRVDPSSRWLPRGAAGAAATAAASVAAATATTAAAAAAATVEVGARARASQGEIGVAIMGRGGCGGGEWTGRRGGADGGGGEEDEKTADSFPEVDVEAKPGSHSNLP